MQQLILNENTSISPGMTDIFRRIKVNIEFSGTGQKSVCITSSEPNEGKSFVSFQVAKAFAEDENKTVLFVDADLRNSVFSHQMGYAKETEGLAEYLAGKLEMDDCIYSTNYDGLYYCPSGRNTKNSTQLLKRDLFRAFLTEVKETYDMVIIDTPPAGQIVDAEIIASIADASVMIVGANMASRGIIKRNIAQLKKANPNFLGVVLNKSKEKTNGYGHKYYYYYGKEHQNE